MLAILFKPNVGTPQHARTEEGRWEIYMFSTNTFFFTW